MNNDLIPHLFRTEYSKLVAVLSKVFGFEQIEIAEDIASETFSLAVDSWPYKGVPQNPAAWLYTVAKNKAKNHIAHNKIFRDKVLGNIKIGDVAENTYTFDFSDTNLQDSQLQMLFAVCHPSIPEESQICLALRILCGFGLDEIADAFLTNKEAVHKKIQRAKDKLRSEKIRIEMPGNERLNERLNTVLHTLYLLFSEGYYSESNNTIIRKELCVEAINLTFLLLSNSQTNTHASNSLMSLMCFHASRLEARQTVKGSMILYDDQDEKLWDTELIEKGFYYLQQASKWDVASQFYIEASIAYWNTVKDDSGEKWQSILNLYDALLKVAPSPVVMLNRIFALSKVHGNETAIREAEELNLNENHFYWVLLAELYRNIDSDKTWNCLHKALLYCKTETEKEMIRNKMEKKL